VIYAIFNSPQLSCWSYFIEKSAPKAGHRLRRQPLAGAMKLFLLLSLSSVGTTAVPISRSVENAADRTERLEPSSLTSTSIPSTGHYPTTRNMQPYMKLMSAEHTSEVFLHEADSYEKLVALCEAGFVSACRAAVNRPE
jgi:hypothetical protein